MSTNILTGIADEAAHDIEGQIAVHRELGWSEIELRMVNFAGDQGEPCPAHPRSTFSIPSVPTGSIVD